MTLPFCSHWHTSNSPLHSLFTQLMFQGLAPYTGNAMNGIHLGTIGETEQLKRKLGEQNH